MIYINVIRHFTFGPEAIQQIKAALMSDSQNTMSITDNFIFENDVQWNWELWGEPHEDYFGADYVYRSYMNPSVYEEPPYLFLDETFVMKVPANSLDEDMMAYVLNGQYEIVESSRFVFSLSKNDGSWIDGEATECGLIVTDENFVDYDG